jgi:ubiquinone biosynthesis protein UbiJ
MIIEVLENAGNRLLRFDPDTAASLSGMQGKVFKLEIQVVDKVLFFIPGEDGLQIREDWQGDVNITLKGSPLGFVQYALRQKNADNRVFQNKKLIIEGDVELAQDFQRILGAIDIDFEELLSHYVGDVAAHQVGRGVRMFRQWAAEAAESLRLDTREYMEEELRVLAPDWRVAAFIDRTDVLRADVERLEQRVKRLGASVLSQK